MFPYRQKYVLGFQNKGWITNIHIQYLDQSHLCPISCGILFSAEIYRSFDLVSLQSNNSFCSFGKKVITQDEKKKERKDKLEWEGN